MMDIANDEQVVVGLRWEDDVKAYKQCDRYYTLTEFRVD